MADGMLLTIGGCAANAAVDLAKMGVRSAVVGRVGKDVFGRIVLEMLREADVDVSRVRASTTADTSQTLIVNVAGQDRRFIHTFGANGEFSADDIADRPRVLRGQMVGADAGKDAVPLRWRRGRERFRDQFKRAWPVETPPPLGRVHRLGDSKSKIEQMTAKAERLRPIDRRRERRFHTREGIGDDMGC